MPRKYVRKPGSRPYKNYTDKHLIEAVKMVLEKHMSVRKASQRYNIHKSTLWLKIKEVRGEAIKVQECPGGRLIFSADEENKFVAHVVAMSSYGFPIGAIDMRYIVKAYLDSTGRNVPIFKHNFPGKEWGYSFFQRHKQIISERTAKNITYTRVIADNIENFFYNLERELVGVVPENVWNYDEINLVDDPENKKVVTRRGVKYPEQAKNSLKACTSLMVCGNYVGDVLPFYINYKAEKLWSMWTENGPTGARYNHTKTGWFDLKVFEDWFTSLVLPILKKQKGIKVLIGDHLSSHISLEVLHLCEENNIKFIALPPNVTHLLQPLDVAVFRPLKSLWRDTLTNWKTTPSASKCSSILKDEFPRLLKELEIAMEPCMKQNLKSGFCGTGIIPLNKQKVLSSLSRRLPSATLQESLINSSGFLEISFLQS